MWKWDTSTTPPWKIKLNYKILNKCSQKVFLFKMLDPTLSLSVSWRTMETQQFPLLELKQQWYAFFSFLCFNYDFSTYFTEFGIDFVGYSIQLVFLIVNECSNKMFTIFDSRHQMILIIKLKSKMIWWLYYVAWPVAGNTRVIIWVSWTIIRLP